MTYNLDKAIADAVKDYNINQIYNSSPNMIHEDDFKEVNCVLCNKEMKSIHDTHNTFPLAKLQSGKEAHEQDTNYRCCTECNKDVFNARLEMRGIKKENVISISMNELIKLRKKLVKNESFFENPEAQKRFKELGQNFYETNLGRDILKQRKEKNYD